MLDFQTSFSFLPSRISIQSPARLHLPLPSSVRCTCPHFFHRPRLALHLPRSSSANLNAHIIVVLGARGDETVRTVSEWRAFLTSSGSVPLIPRAPDGGDASCIQLCRPPCSVCRSVPVVGAAAATHFVRNFFAYICRDRPWQE